MTRVPFVAGNWKMNLASDDSMRLVRELLEGKVTSIGPEVAVFPSFPMLGEVALLLSGSTLGLGAQDVHAEKKGAFTGGVSATMLRSVSCEYVLTGHSERRWGEGEDDLTVARKAKTAVEEGLVPIVCVGEILRQRTSGETLPAIDRQLSPVFQELGAAPDRMLFAYEPVWAIGTGHNATGEQAQEVHAHIRRRIAERWGEAADSIRILYGGSVTPDNCASIATHPDVDGALVGGASLKAESFVGIIREVARAGGPS